MVKTEIRMSTISQYYSKDEKIKNMHPVDYVAELGKIKSFKILEYEDARIGDCFIFLLESENELNFDNNDLIETLTNE